MQSSSTACPKIGSSIDIFAAACRSCVKKKIKIKKGGKHVYKLEAQSIDICAEKGSIFVLKPHTLVAKGRHFRRRMPHLGEKVDVVIGERDVGGGHVADASHRAPIFVRQLLLDAARRERKRPCHIKKKNLLSCWK